MNRQVKVMVLDLESAAHLMGVRTTTLMALTKPVKGCAVGEAGLKYVRKGDKYSFDLQDVADWLKLRLQTLNQFRKEVKA